ncbi:uncharacterized protein LOC122791493 [Protopterus annectens]|uniref:uncharacterized protein LOC122791493 n=1 Tax=Protopterus annectens TaxID=7888 RepID=UPI001CF97A39|nr:uncharacterized protein LOC122791493 [Protopterus annectens]
MTWDFEQRGYNAKLLDAMRYHVPGDHLGSVTLLNVSADTSGLYRCTVSNLLGSGSCSLELHVEIVSSSGSGIIVGITVTLTMGLILLTLFALLLWLHHSGKHKWVREKDKDKEEEGSYNDISVDAISPGRLMTSKRPYLGTMSTSRSFGHFGTFDPPGSQRFNPLCRASGNADELQFSSWHRLSVPFSYEDWVSNQLRAKASKTDLSYNEDSLSGSSEADKEEMQLFSSGQDVNVTSPLSFKPDTKSSHLQTGYLV